MQSDLDLDKFLEGVPLEYEPCRTYGGEIPAAFMDLFGHNEDIQPVVEGCSAELAQDIFLPELEEEKEENGFPSPEVREMGNTSRRGHDIPEVDMALLLQGVTDVQAAHHWKYIGHDLERFQFRIFAVEWNGSVLSDPYDLIRGLFTTLGPDIAFVLGLDGRGSENDYRLVVRSNEKVRWRDWRAQLSFGLGYQSCMGPAVCAKVPVVNSTAGCLAFVREVLQRYETFPRLLHFRRDDLFLEQARNVPRPRKRGAEFV